MTIEFASGPKLEMTEFDIMHPMQHSQRDSVAVVGAQSGDVHCMTEAAKRSLPTNH
jgi:hypothetical protein